VPIWIRRIIYLLFIGCFLLVAPLLALYSMGYRYHPDKHRIERTGLILVDGTPRTTRVLIDGVERAIRLPARIGSLIPNTYSVRVERKGYHPSMRQLTVSGGRTSFFTGFSLFHDTDPTIVHDGTIHAFSSSSDGTWAAYILRAEGLEELWLIDLSTDEQSLIARSPLPSDDGTEPTALTWSPRDSVLMVRTANDAFIVDPADPRTREPIADLLPHAPSVLSWELDSSAAIIAESAGRLFRLHRATGRVTVLPIDLPKAPYALARGTLYTVDDTSVVAIPTNGSQKKTIAQLPRTATVSAFTNLSGAALSLEVTRPDRSLTIVTSTGSIAIREGGHLRSSPRDPKTILWFANAYELWAEGDAIGTRLLERRETPLVDAVWHPKKTHAILASERDVTAIPLDPASTTLPITLATFSSITSLAVTTDGSVLYIAGDRNGRTGLWHLQLQ
jgi:hypothetical protein